MKGFTGSKLVIVSNDDDKVDSFCTNFNIDKTYPLRVSKEELHTINTTDRLILNTTEIPLTGKNKKTIHDKIVKDIFVHLHGHDEFSLRDAIPSCKELVKRCVEIGQPAIAVTNHGNICSYLRLHEACKEKGVKPIFGCEVYINHHRDELKKYINEDPTWTKKQKDEAKEKRKVLGKNRFHFILLAKNEAGFKSLVRIVNEGWMNCFYRFPLVDYDVIE